MVVNELKIYLSDLMTAVKTKQYHPNQTNTPAMLSKSCINTITEEQLSIDA